MSNLTIFKYRLSHGVQTIALPAGAKILTVQYQHFWPHMWVLLDPSGRSEMRTILVEATGVTIPSDAHYIATFQQDDGNLVFHAFELPTHKDSSA